MLGAVIGKWAYLMSFLAFVLFSIFWIMNLLISNQRLVSDEAILAALDNVQISIALLIVCVPEGLPLAVSMAMAFSTDRLKKDNLLIKDLKALETAGSLVAVMTGKTSTLTEGNMTVKNFLAGG